MRCYLCFQRAVLQPEKLVFEAEESHEVSLWFCAGGAQLSQLPSFALYQILANSVAIS